MTTDTVNVSQRIGAALGTRSVTPKERGALARASEGVTTWDELPMGAQALVEAIEDRPLTGNAMPDEEPVGKPGKKPGLTAAAPLYGVTDLGLRIGTGHTLCDLLTFCRNPLHPGPCKGWKHSLRAVAPGLHETMEKDRLAKVDARRAERAAAGTTPKVRALQHERSAAFWRKNAAPAPLKAGEHRTLTAPDGTRAEIFQTGAGVTVQVRDGAGASRADLTKTFPTETQALAHLADVAGKLAGEQDRGGTGPGRAAGGAPVIPAERQRRLDAAAARTKAAFERKGSGGTVDSTRTSDGKGATVEKQNDGLDRYRTTAEEYRNHYDGYTDNELKRAAHDERVATQGRPRKEIIADLAKVRAAQDRDVLERNLRDRAGGSGGGSTETRPAGVGDSLELTEIGGGWKGGGKPPRRRRGG